MKAAHPVVLAILNVWEAQHKALNKQNLYDEISEILFVMRL